MLLDNMKKEAPAKGAKRSKEQQLDLDIATSMGKTVVSNPEMQNALVQATQSAEPTMAIGQFIAQSILKLKEESINNGLELDDNIWLSDGGVADTLIDHTVKNLSGQVEGLEGAEGAILEEVLNVVKLASQSGGAPQEGAPPPQGGPPPDPMMGGF